MGVSGRKMLPIWTTFAVKQGTVSLTLNLYTETERKVDHSITVLYCQVQLHGRVALVLIRPLCPGSHT